MSISERRWRPRRPGPTVPSSISEGSAVGLFEFGLEKDVWRAEAMTLQSVQLILVAKDEMISSRVITATK